MFGKAVNTLVNLLILGAVIFTLASPQGPFADWRTRRSARKEFLNILALHRPEISQGAVLGQLQSGHQPVVFTDYQCPFCRASEGEIQRFIEENPDRGLLVLHFPLEAIHPFARGAALAAICADEAGHFPAMHHLLMTTELSNETEWGELAAEAGVGDLVWFEECTTAERTEARLERDRELGNALGVRGTPTFIIGDELQSGGVTARQLIDGVEG